jgi:LemA protein
MLIFVVIVVAVLLYLLFVYNSLITLKMRVSEAFSQIDVQLKRRTDLIPNLVEAVKGYAKHEKQLLEKVTEQRANLVNAKGAMEKAKANNQISEALKSLFAVAENYPDLKASQNFMELQQELSDTEDKIAYSRQFYNSNVMEFNTKIAVFPNTIFAGVLGFKSAEFFGVEEKDKQPVKVSF